MKGMFYILLSFHSPTPSPTVLQVGFSLYSHHRWFSTVVNYVGQLTSFPTYPAEPYLMTAQLAWFKHPHSTHCVLFHHVSVLFHLWVWEYACVCVWVCASLCEAICIKERMCVLEVTRVYMSVFLTYSFFHPTHNIWPGFYYSCNTNTQTCTCTHNPTDMSLLSC